jgi:DNA-binding transcriptional regulator YiaG
MTPEQFENGRKKLEMTGAFAAVIFDVDIRTIWRWESGMKDKDGNEVPVPGPAARLMSVLLRDPDQARFMLE